MVAKIIFGIILFILYVIMMSIMIIFERNKPRNIIFWSIIFLIFSVLAYPIYALIKLFYYKKRQKLFKKEKDDEVYAKLISAHLNPISTKTYDHLFTFNSMAYNTVLTTNNDLDLLIDFNEFIENLTKDMLTATNYIYLEFSKITFRGFDFIRQTLFSLAEKGVKIKFVYDVSLPIGLKKELKDNNISVYRFSKNRVGYKNFRNVISIDGRIVYLCNLCIKAKHLNKDVQTASVNYRLKGDIVQEIDLRLRQDTIFASGKHIDYSIANNKLNNRTAIQYLSNEISMDIELALIKAISMAKTSIQLMLDEFIPTESIMSLLKFAINSNIQVKLMVPIKTYIYDKYYASRAYAKEVALYGASVYLFDGYINSNQIVIDSKYAICGSYDLDKEQINTSLQNMLIVEDQKIVNELNKYFDNCVNNSYKINDAKYMLLKEKFFKNFV